MNATPPIELQRLGLPGEIIKKGATEWASACPRCNGTDRFVIFTDRPYPHWRYLCRVCNPEGGWIDQLWPDLVEQERNQSPQERAKQAADRAKEAEERLHSEIQRAQDILRELQEARAWLRYHEQLTDEARQTWESWGIPEFYQSYWQLGFDPDHIVWTGQTEWHTPTMTIPIFEQGSWECLNIRHRLMKPPRLNDKYRPERSGLPAQFFIAEPDLELRNTTLLVEGEKKAMVSFITADNPNLQVLGTPGKNLPGHLVSKLHDCDPIYICYDPDAIADARRLAGILGIKRCRIIELPDKIDDLIIRHGLDKSWMRNRIRQAVKA